MYIAFPTTVTENNNSKGYSQKCNREIKIGFSKVTKKNTKKENQGNKIQRTEINDKMLHQNATVSVITLNENSLNKTIKREW